jgi:predicted ArsR family transcriptional regulator
MKSVDKILHTIKRDGAITAKQLAEQLSITTMGARQHLQTLEDDGLLRFHDVKVKVGRPTRHWSLTEKGHQQFSDRHNDLAIQVLDAVEHLFGTEGLNKIAEEREAKTLAHYQSAIKGCTSSVEKLHMIAQLREQEGYMVEIEDHPQGYLLIENHCPICKAATRCDKLCQSELNIFSKLLANDFFVERKEHIVTGQRRCTYLISHKK